MAALPSPSQVAGEHLNMFSALYEKVKKPDGNIPAVEAAALLKKSGLSDSVLSKIWDLSDQGGKGYLNKQGFFVALKLISLAQAGHNLDFSLLCNASSAPKLGNTPIPITAPKSIDWSISPSKQSEYEMLFNSLQPSNGFIPGNQVKSLLMDSKLPVDTLCKIWDLADIDKDGSLNRAEFSIAMHLVYKALEKYVIPNSLPPELLPANQGKSNSENCVPVNGEAPVPWVVSKDEKTQYDVLFKSSDIDEDGFVSGHEIKNVFLQSGLTQSVLANIWALCDIKQCGKLNSEQFALAMWLIKKKLSGGELPPSLAPEMVPPSFRAEGCTGENNNIPYENPEIELINKDIEEFRREKQMLEGEVLQKEADVTVKIGETNSLQGELDTLVATLKQLENQKGEASKRLNDLKAQVAKLEQQAEEQNAIVTAQEEELSSKKRELEDLKKEESELETTQKQLTDSVNGLDKTLQETQLSISQIKMMYDQLTEFQRQLKEATEMVDSYLTSGDVINVSHIYLELEPIFRENSFQKLLDTEKEPAPVEFKENTQTSYFENTGFGNDPFSSRDNYGQSAFGNSDPFSSFGANSFSKPDPFTSFDSGAAKVEEEGPGNDPFGCEPFAAPALPPKNKQPPPRPAPPRPQPPAHSPTPHKNPAPANPQGDSFADFSTFFPKSESQQKMEFTEDPFSNYRYADPFEMEDPFNNVQEVSENHIDNDNFALSK